MNIEIRPQPKQYQAYLKLFDNETMFIGMGGGAGGGKKTDISSKIVTPTGEKYLYDLKEGDEVCSPDGSIQTILKLHPITEEEQYTLVMKNGDSVVACADHLWYGGWRRDKSDFMASWNNPNCIKTTKQVYEHTGKENQRTDGHKRLFQIPLTEPVIFNEQELVIPPYLMGQLLGNSCFTRKEFFKLTSSIKDVGFLTDYLNNKEVGFSLVDFRKVNGKLCADIFIRFEKKELFLKELESVGLFGKKGVDKFVPNKYLVNSAENRFEVLRGLMDSDGTVDKTGKISFDSTSEQLAKNVKWLAQSLGFYASISKRTGRVRSGYVCRNSWVVNLRGKNNEQLFNLKRKKERTVQTRQVNWQNSNTVVDVILNPTKVKMRCITVSGEAGLYLINSFIVTHNTWLGCEWLLMNCYRYPGFKGFMARKELKRLMASTYVTWQKVCTYYKIPQKDWKLEGKYNYIEFVDGLAKGSRIDLLDVSYKPSDPMYERFGSLECTDGWGEEVGEWDFGAFDVLKSRLGRWKNDEFIPLGHPAVPKFLLTFNPTKNWLYRLFYKPWKEGVLPKEYSFTQSLYMDNAFTAEKYGKMLTQISDPVMRQRLRDGIWEYSDELTVLMPYENIVDLFTNHSEFSNDLFLTADVARFGSDRTAYTLWRGLNMIQLITKKHQGVDQTITDIRTLLGENRIPYSHCVVDEDGVGGGVVDGLRGVKGFVNNSSPIKTPLATDKSQLKSENFKNLKSQASYLLAEKVNNHIVSITAELTPKDREYLIEELGQIRRKVTDDDTTLQLIPKDDIKQNLGRSPDLADAMVMRMFFELDRPKRFIMPDLSQIGFGGVNPYY